MLKAAIRRLTCKIEFVPVLCGSAFKKRACSTWSTRSSIICRARSTFRRPRAWIPTIRTKPIEVPSDDNGKFCSLAFKLWTDPFVGKLVFFRVYSGQLKKGDTIYNPRTRKRERVSRVMIRSRRTSAKTSKPSYAGDIAALVGFKKHHHR